MINPHHMTDTTTLMWHPDLIKLFFEYESGQQRVNLLEGLNSGNLNKSILMTKEAQNNQVLLAYVEEAKKSENDWAGGDEWNEKFRDYLELESVIVKPFEGYWEKSERCWYLSEGHYGDIGYYVMEYCLVPIGNPQSINYLTLKLD